MDDVEGLPVLEIDTSAPEVRIPVERLQELGRQLIAALDADGFRQGALTAIHVGTTLGNLGWTLPMDATPRETQKLLDHAQHDNIDNVFLRYYDADRLRSYRYLKNSLLSSKSLKPWRRLIRQALAAYEARQYLVVVPALLSAVEGLIVHQAGSQWRTMPSPKPIVKAQRESALPASMTLAICCSIEAFIHTVFCKADFTAARPAVLNRHWVAHGRDLPAWNRADCLRLFQALDTIALDRD